MKIAVLNGLLPYVRGGAEYLSSTLEAKLREAGHVVEHVDMPINEQSPGAVVRSILAARLLAIAGEADLVIALKFPVYLVPHARKKVWLLHQLRQVYDLWDTQFVKPTSFDTAWDAARHAVLQADAAYLPECSEIYTISRRVAERLRMNSAIEATGVIYPPLAAPDRYRQGGSGDYLFFPSRVNPLKRQTLVVEAMRFVKSDARLVLAGNADHPSYDAEIQARIRDYHLQDRVQHLGYISEERKLDLSANAAAFVYTPYDEDYGYVVIEAMQCGKPTITTRDSGGPTEFIQDGVNGLVAEPNAQALAAAIDDLMGHPDRRQSMGLNARLMVDDLQLHWDHVLERLLS